MSAPATPPPLSRVIAAMEGYADLGLTDLAWEEFESLPAADRALPAVLEAELQLLMRQRRWDDALVTGHQLLAAAPSCGHGYIHTAYAFHALGRTVEARAVLSKAPASLKSEPLYHYNMACYLAVLGDLGDAESCLRKAWIMDDSLRVHARTDPDLAELLKTLPDGELQ